MKKDLDLRTQSSISYNFFPKNIANDYIYHMTEFHDQTIYNSQDILRNVLYLVC